MLTERTRLSHAALELLAALTRLGASSFGPLLHVFLPPLLRLLSRPNKLYVTRASSCLASIIARTRLPAIVAPLCELLETEKSVSARRASAEALAAVLEHHVELSDKLLGEVEQAIRRAAVDREASVREASRAIWNLYRQQYIARVQQCVLRPSCADESRFSDALTPLVRRYLHIPTTAAPSAQPAQIARLPRPATSLGIAAPKLTRSVGPGTGAASRPMVAQPTLSRSVSAAPARTEVKPDIHRDLTVATLPPAPSTPAASQPRRVRSASASAKRTRSASELRQVALGSPRSVSPFAHPSIAVASFAATAFAFGPFGSQPLAPFDPEPTLPFVSTIPIAAPSILPPVPPVASTSAQPWPGSTARPAQHSRSASREAFKPIKSGRKPGRVVSASATIETAPVKPPPVAPPAKVVPTAAALPLRVKPSASVEPVVRGQGASVSQPFRPVKAGTAAAAKSGGFGRATARSEAKAADAMAARIQRERGKPVATSSRKPKPASQPSFAASISTTDMLSRAIALPLPPSPVQPHASTDDTLSVTDNMGDFSLLALQTAPMAIADKTPRREPLTALKLENNL